MVQLLIVDDEMHVVERLAGTIDWQAIGIEQVHKAYNGLEALELMEQALIDIVITDIQMPGMTGLELAAMIQRRWPKTKCLLLSGYSEFEYAQEALRYGTEDYLLKPVKEPELVAAVGRVMEKLREEWQEVVSRQRLTYTLKENLPLLRSTLLSDVLQGLRMSEASLREKMDLLGLAGHTSRSFSIMMIRLEEAFLEFDPSRLSLMEYAIGNMVEELFGDRYDSWNTKDPHDYLVFVMTEKQGTTDPDGAAWFERTANQLQAAVSTYLKGTISILVSTSGNFPAELRLLYSRSVEAFRRHIGREKELFLRIGEELGQLAPEVSSLQSLYEPPTLIHLLEASRWESIEEKLQAAFEEMERKQAESQEHVMEVYFSIASAYTYISHKNGRQLSQLIAEDYGKLTEGVPFRTLQQLKDWAYRTLRRIREDLERQTQDTRHSVIRQIQQFIEHNISNDVSLQKIAEHVYLHPVYVSKIYKLETGENLSDYLHRVRMDKAEYLLRNTDEKIYEIAAQLGYQRPHSFNHAFKKAFGKTPQEYRDQHSAR
ncbi:response regulator [Paenibacillus sp. GD4]|uniref:response regulator transcription factor n=1 Tax=Paenibacillus sp. GD4 TaxID=3068890 RepID=UPI00279685D1|nr:response regulator [Paenibacillus sp. GD4]MDQ1910762.1 response regulator [Paenibacillus sp. GD4]